MKGTVTLYKVDSSVESLRFEMGSLFHSRGKLLKYKYIVDNVGVLLFNGDLQFIFYEVFSDSRLADKLYCDT